MAEASSPETPRPAVDVRWLGTMLMTAAVFFMAGNAASSTTLPPATAAAAAATAVGGASKGPLRSSPADTSAGGSSRGSQQWAPPPWHDPPGRLALSAPRCAELPDAWPSVDEALADSHTDKGPSRLNLPADMIHEYGPAYARHIGPLRDRELRVLEIGIGCTPWMPVEGGSLAFWRSYVPCVHLTWVDFDGGCVERIGSRADAAFQADQSVPADLLRVYSQGGPFDVIVDDGGHTMKQQITTLRTLFPKLPPAGIFVLEDLLTSFFPPSMGGHDMVPQANTTGARFVSDVISHMHMKSNKPFFVRPETLEGSAEIARLALAVDCYREICVLVRNGLPA